MTHFRPFRNSDTPALTTLWNRGLAGNDVAAPLSVREFESHVTGRAAFDRLGLIVAERDGRPVGFAHAAFGPETDDPAPLRLSHALGAVAMLVVDPESEEDPDLGAGLMAAAEEYLRDRGASVIYAGGQDPLNLFYWGLYGGSEWSGVLAPHLSFHRAAAGAGFEAVSTSVLLEADLAEPEPRDPKGVLVRRHTRLEVTEDPPLAWAEGLAIGTFDPRLHRLLVKATGTEVARASTWDMTWYGRRDGRSRVGLIDMEVEPNSRRQGYGRFLVSAILKQARLDGVAVVAVQTRATNAAALALYESVGFRPVGTSTLYRRPG